MHAGVLPGYPSPMASSTLDTGQELSRFVARSEWGLDLDLDTAALDSSSRQHTPY